MAGETEYETLELDAAESQEKQREILEALKVLFDLLEEYAPMWYTEEHRQQALSALECTAKHSCK